MEQHELLRRVAEVFEGLEVPYLIVGSIASIAYGEARFTQDIDVVAALEQRHVPGFLNGFPAPAFYRSEPAIREAIRTGFQFNVIHPGSGNKVDVILPRNDRWAIERMERRRPVRLLPDRCIMVAAPEDVILGKLWYHAEGGGDRHLRDIAGILRVTGAGVDRSIVERWARELGYLEVWRAIVAKADAPDPPPGQHGKASAFG